MTRAFVDPRVRMRNALRALLLADPDGWHEPSLTVFRNRLLDQTGSDARPLAELLMEALQRGWRERMPRERVDAARWDALAAPFVMQWSAERFVQPDMAQWATESWAFAFGVIAPEQLRIAPPTSPARAQTTPAVIAASSTVVRGGRNANRGATRSASLTAAATRPTSAVTRRRSRYVPSTLSGISQPSPRMVWSFASAAVFMYVFFLGRMFMTVRENKRLDAAALSKAAPAVVSPTVVSPTVVSPAISSPAVVPSAASTPAIVPRTAVAETLVVRNSDPFDSSRRVSDAPANMSTGSNPGVPSVTRNLLDERVVDPQRMLYVEPARRAQGNSRPVPSVAAQPSLAFDEMVLNNGTTMRGRVEIVRAGTVIFRDSYSGLRHEIRKDSVDRIITEFGAPVRFRAADANIAAGTPRSAELAKRRSDNGPRNRGVAGAYAIRYATAVVVGSPECRDVWRRAPNATDRARVAHQLGADTLRVDFDGGDTFLSNMDADGYFASTFRIVPDQARTSTALTTRLTGQFKTDGSLAMQVIIVFYRRMREGRDITCSVTVNARGTRE